MSQVTPYTIECPKCRATQTADLVDSINVAENPEYKEQLMKNTLNRVTCEQCAFEFRVDKHLFYADPDNQILIYLMNASPTEFETAREEFEETSTLMNRMLPGEIDAPEIQLVLNRTELVEKIFLNEARLNDRVIEYIKYLIYLNNADKIDPRSHVLLFNAQDSTEKELVFVVQDMGTSQFVSVMQYSRQAYNALTEALDASDDQAAMIMELFPGPYNSARLLAANEEAMEDEGPL